MAEDVAATDASHRGCEIQDERPGEHTRAVASLAHITSHSDHAIQRAIALCTLSLLTNTPAVMTTHLKLAVCLYPDACPTDFQGPTELLSSLLPRYLKQFGLTPAYSMDFDFLATTAEPVQGSSGPALVPTRTFGSIQPEEKFDVILVPGGMCFRVTLQEGCC